MPRNPKQDANLKPIKKGELTSEEAKRRGKNGGEKSGEVRRAKRDARQSARYILELAAKGQIAKNLDELGIPKNEQTNMAALHARLAVMALGGNLEAYKTLMKMAGYDPEENREERESINSDRRKDMESEVKINTLGGGAPEGANIAVNMQDGDGFNDVVIYLPPVQDESECEVPTEGTEIGGEEK